MSPRYAIYYAPAADSALWLKASAWLGRDAYADAPVERPAIPGLEDLNLDALTADPRGYGFHATLKAPFELAPGRSDDALLGFAEAFADRQTAFEAAIAPATLGRFLAFRLDDEPAQMRALHEGCVREFDPYRAPLRDSDLARRRKAPLTPEQDCRLQAWGYPYIFNDFRFHMTLTNEIRDEALSVRLLEALKAHFAEETGPHRFDAVAVFKQDERAAPFRIIGRFGFGG